MSVEGSSLACAFLKYEAVVLEVPPVPLQHTMTKTTDDKNNDMPQVKLIHFHRSSFGNIFFRIQKGSKKQIWLLLLFICVISRYNLTISLFIEEIHSHF